MATSDPIVPTILAQHVEETSFLWVQRGVAVRAPNVFLHELARHDDRIIAHMDGVRIAGQAGLQVFDARLAAGDAGAMFAAVVLALEERNKDRITALLSAGETAGPLQKGLISGFGWTSARFLQGTAMQLLAGVSAFARLVGIASCAMHGADPRQSLNAAIEDSEPALRCRALRAAGELGRTDLLRPAVEHGHDSDPACAFAAAWSAVLLGNRGASLETLIALGMDLGGHKGESALGFALQAMNMGAAHAMLRSLAETPGRARWLVQGSGIAGDPAYVPWLLKQMRDVQRARAAGQSFSLISGADITALNLGAQPPENFESGPNDDPDDPNVEMDPDDGLTWPDVVKIEKWWRENSSRFAPGTRYFMGAPVTREVCIDVLKNGYQRQRIIAAHYLCLLEPGTPLFNTSAPAWRQQRLLAKMT